MASVKLPDKQLTELRAFVSLVKTQPSILSQPELQFFKDYIESVGGVIPAAEPPKSCPRDHGHGHKEEEKSKPPPQQHDEEPDIIESDIELDNTGVIGKFSFKEIFFLIHCSLWVTSVQSYNVIQFMASALSR